ncbi:DUF2314 domain-containing protein [Hymenobacter sp. UYP22]|uniref:DUF2314 domain-containing protein n=1 Tax=Hymenobacter sp. UYP22 TaxID=3156348 RepID=UPI00339930E7
MMRIPVCRFLGLVALLLSSQAAVAQQPRNEAPLASTAPTDRPVAIAGTSAEAELRAFDKLLAPAIKQARRTLPQAKQRFLKGLPAGHAFFLTTRIFDPSGAYEQVFVRVREWNGTTVKGIISNDLNVVRSYQPGQLITFPESAVLDWTVAMPDGGEEGNFVGKFLDAQQR